MTQRIASVGACFFLTTLLSACHYCKPRLLKQAPIHLIPVAAPSEKLDGIGEIKPSENQDQLTYSIDRHGKFRIDGSDFERQLDLLDDRPRSGLLLVELSPEIRPLVLPSNGPESNLVVLDMVPGGPAFFSDLRVRDLILQVDGQAVATIDDYGAILEHSAAGDTLEVSAWRPLKSPNATFELAENSTEKTGFNFINLIKSESGPGEREFSFFWELLYVSKFCYSLYPNPASSTLEPVEEGIWSAVFGLVNYQKTINQARFRVFWIVPVWTKGMRRLGS